MYMENFSVFRTYINFQRKLILYKYRDIEKLRVVKTENWEKVCLTKINIESKSPF